MFRESVRLGDGDIGDEEGIQRRGILRSQTWVKKKQGFFFQHGLTEIAMWTITIKVLQNI